MLSLLIQRWTAWLMYGMSTRVWLHSICPALLLTLNQELAVAWDFVIPARIYLASSIWSLKRQDSVSSVSYTHLGTTNVISLIITYYTTKICCTFVVVHNFFYIFYNFFNTALHPPGFCYLPSEGSVLHLSLIHISQQQCCKYTSFHDFDIAWCDSSKSNSEYDCCQ